MTNQHAAPNQQTTDGSSIYNVIAVSFDDDQTAQTAMTRLQELDAQERVVLHEAVVVERRDDGQVVEADKTESTLMLGTASGGVIGALIGIIGGPLGMLVGGVVGLYAGALADIHDADEVESALAGISNSVRAGRTALLAVVTEQSPDVIDSAMSDLGGTVLRRSVADVDAEVAAAEKAQHKASLEARKELIRGRQAHIAADYDAHLTKAEDHLEVTARKAETSFKEHTAAPEARLESAEDHLEAAAHKAETRATQRLHSSD